MNGVAIPVVRSSLTALIDQHPERLPWRVSFELDAREIRRSLKADGDDLDELSAFMLVHQATVGDRRGLDASGAEPSSAVGTATYLSGSSAPILDVILFVGEAAFADLLEMVKFGQVPSHVSFSLEDDELHGFGDLIWDCKRSARRRLDWMSLDFYRDQPHR